MSYSLSGLSMRDRLVEVLLQTVMENFEADLSFIFLYPNYSIFCLKKNGYDSVKVLMLNSRILLKISLFLLLKI
jgi:hypothetical protein